MTELIHLICPCHVGLDDILVLLGPLGVLSSPVWLSVAFRGRNRR